MSTHRAGINPGFLIRHTLSLCGLNEHNARLIVADLDKLPCMDRVELNRARQKLRISYDASRYNINAMIAVVMKHGVSLKPGWWQRTRLGWQRQIDKNIRDNATHVAHCCNKMPDR